MARVVPHDLPQSLNRFERIKCAEQVSLGTYEYSTGLFPGVGFHQGFGVSDKFAQLQGAGIVGQSGTVAGQTSEPI